MSCADNNRQRSIVGEGIRMRLWNTCESIVRQFSGRAFDLTAWREYAAQLSPELPAKCEEDAAMYDFGRDVLPVITAALENRDKLTQVRASFEAVAAELEERVHCLFGSREPEMTILLYLGLCNGAGWATTLDGRDAVLLGIEKIIELDWCDFEKLRALIYHEVGHIWHKTAGCLDFPVAGQREQSILQLYQEGVAMVCEQLLCGDDNYYHQDRNGWLAWCRKGEIGIRREYLNRLNAGKSTQDFFGDWCSYNGHADVGYFLGCQFVRDLLKHYSLEEVAALPYAVLDMAFERYAKQ